MEEPENLLKVLKEARGAVEKSDSHKLSDLSNQVIHSASIGQEPENTAVAVIIYSLSKIIERKYYHEEKGWGKFYDVVVSIQTHSILNNGFNRVRIGINFNGVAIGV